MQKPLYQHLARLLDAATTCERTGNTEWRERHLNMAGRMVTQLMPSGSGIDSGTTVCWDASGPDRIVMFCSFHHMTDYGMYDGWTDHEVIVTPSLAKGFYLRVTGRDRNDIKSYLAETYDHALRQIVDDDDARFEER